MSFEYLIKALESLYYFKPTPWRFLINNLYFGSDISLAYK